MAPSDPEGEVCRRLGGKVRHLEIDGKNTKIYDYYYPDSVYHADGTESHDENTLVITKRDEKLLFLKLFLDRIAGYEERIEGWNYPFPFHQKFYVEKMMTRWDSPETRAKNLLKNIDSPWRIYFHYDYHYGGDRYDYYIGIESEEEKQYHQKYEKNVEDRLKYALQQCAKLHGTTNVKLLSDVAGEFIVYPSGNMSVDYDSKYRALDHYVLVANNRIYMGTLEFPRYAALRPGRYRIVGRTIPSTGLFDEVKIKISIKSAECLDVIENSPLDGHYHKNLKSITSYNSGVQDRMEKEIDEATILWNYMSSEMVRFIIFTIFFLTFIFGAISGIIAVLNWLA